MDGKNQLGVGIRDGEIDQPRPGEPGVVVRRDRGDACAETDTRGPARMLGTPRLDSGTSWGTVIDRTGAAFCSDSPTGTVSTRPS